MTGTTPEEAAGAPPEQDPTARPAPVPCPRCGAPVAPDQAWCLECGLAARTRLAPTPNWRAPLAVAAAVGALALVALVVAFLVVTNDNAPLPTTTPAAAAPVPPAPTVTAPATTAPATAPPSTTTIPPATVPASPAPTPTTTAPTGAG